MRNVVKTIARHQQNHRSMQFHQSGNSSLIRQSGRKQLNLSGIEMMQLVKDVEQGLLIKKGNSFISTISNHLSMSNLEKMLAISYFFAEIAIDGLIPITTQKIDLSFQLIDGYTEGVSNTQRYKMLGNGGCKWGIN